MLIALAAAAAILAQAAVTPAPEPPAATSTPAPTIAPATVKPAKPKLICHDEIVTGSIMSRRVCRTREQIEAKLIEYCAAEMARGTYLGSITRHALGLYRGEAGARGWRRVLSDSKRLAARDLTIFDEARQHLREPVEIFE